MRHDAEDLRSFWKDLRPDTKTSSKGLSTLDQRVGCLDDLFEKALEDTLDQMEGSPQKDTQDAVTEGVRLFKEAFLSKLSNENLAGLLEFILQGQYMNIQDLRGFMRALPTSFLYQVVGSVTGSATGIHVLVSVELAHRSQEIVSYNIIHDDGRVQVDFLDRRNRQVSFYLDDEIEILDNPSATTTPTEASTSL